MNKWISVKDRNPEYLVDVIAYCEKLEDGANYLAREKYYAIDRFIENWTDEHAPSFRTDRFFNAKVTHWMPLPEAPYE